MRRRITGFHPDELGDWVAELDCLHGQHVRHQPPFRSAPWVVDDAGRASRVGAELDCPLCDRTELPEGLELARRTPTWDEGSVPAALLRDHRVASATWGLLVVEEGTVTFTAATAPPLRRVVTAGESQPIPPELPHHVELAGTSRFHVDFLVRPPAE